MKNVISQSLWLDLVNINVYAKVYKNIPLSSRDRATFIFSEFEPRQRLGQSQIIFDNPLGYILSISMHMQNFIKIFQSFKSYRHFSRTGRGQNLHKQSKDKIFTNCTMTKSNVWLFYEIQLQVSVDFLRVVQFQVALLYNAVLVLAMK